MCLAIGFGHKNGDRHSTPSCGAGLKFIKRVLGYCHNIHATVAPVGMACLERSIVIRAHRICSYAFIDEQFSPPIVYITPSSSVIVFNSPLGLGPVEP